MMAGEKESKSEVSPTAGGGAKVLVIGGGGREHAIVWSLGRSARVGEIVCAPGNGGIAALARCVPVDTTDLHGMVQLAATEAPDMVVIGPEVPLALGLTDALQTRGLRVFGPTRAAAELESSKGFAKRFMQRHNIPTAKYAACSSAKEAHEALELVEEPLVVKADGLHAGKGVTICATKAEAGQVIDELFSGVLLGKAETTVLLEELLEGEDLSLLVMSDGRHATPLAPAQDHKRIGEGDTGVNTGGMGVYSTDAMLSDEMRTWIMHHVAQPTIDGMAAEGTPFLGVLFLGLMMTARGPMVLEYNTRFGDPETQAVLLRLKNDLFEAFESCVDGRLSETEFRWHPGASVCVVAASGGYPGSYRTGLPIDGLSDAANVPGVVVFHAGTRLDDTIYRTSGGRVLGVCAAKPTLEAALANAYSAMDRIAFDGMVFRRDIGHRALGATPAKQEGDGQ
jgi:phosphoribosylamine--glycine ligase